MESVLGHDLMSRDSDKDTQVLIQGEQVCSKVGPSAVNVLLPCGGGSRGGGGARPVATPCRPCPGHWLLSGALLLSLVLLTSIGVCFWQLYALQTRVQGLQDQLALCPCGGQDAGRAGKPDGEVSTAAAAQSGQTRRLLPTQRQKEMEVDEENEYNIYNLTDGSDVERKMQRQRRSAMRFPRSIRVFVHKKLAKLQAKLETTVTVSLAKLNYSWQHELRSHQHNLTLHPSKVNLHAIHMYAFVNISVMDHEKLLATHHMVDVKSGNLTRYGLRPMANNTAYTFWKVASWFNQCTLKSGAAFYFPCDKPGSEVSIRRIGVYFIYVHITYHDDMVLSGFRLILERYVEGRKETRNLVKCINNIRPPTIRDRPYRTCDVTTLQRLEAGDSIRIDRAITFNNLIYIEGFGNNDPKPAETSYWGMVQIIDDAM